MTILLYECVSQIFPETVKVFLNRFAGTTHANSMYFSSKIGIVLAVIHHTIALRVPGEGRYVAGSLIYDNNLYSVRILYT